ncbi:MAG: hypothetical protein LQ344_004335 [Seirophora lacunosa]|nr:MAG: hypothetical protein LQ344_004335 [Seirophora lacunosa]
MPATLASLPCELLTSILETAASFNARDLQQYTYGFHSATHDRTLRGHVAPDASRWLSTKSIRCVCRQWHDWVTQYALRALYIRRWRGSERKTVNLFTRYPALASSVRRIFFDGFYDTETSAMIFDILQHCSGLESASLPWTTLRYGNSHTWEMLLRPRDDGTALSSLELLAVDLKQSQIAEAARQMDRRPLDSAQVRFNQLKRLKLSGSSNLMPINDDDLVSISQTARLHEIHITGTTAVTTKGLIALACASQDTLRVLEHSPLSDDGFKHPDALSAGDGKHLCEEIINCPRLSSLSISLPTMCSTLFSQHSVRWTGDVQIRAAGVCSLGSLKQSVEARRAVFDILAQSRQLIAAQEAKGIELRIEFFIDHLIFEPWKSLVHADMSIGRFLSDGSWPLQQSWSTKGPYGQTGQYGKDEQPYSCISEAEFFEGLRKGYISF